MHAQYYSLDMDVIVSDKILVFATSQTLKDWLTLLETNNYT